MEELQEAIVEKRKKNKQKSGGEAAGIRAVFYMENKKTLTGCISLPVDEPLNSEEIVKDYQKQLSNIKLGKESTLTHHAFIACFGNLCVDMQKCIGFEVIFFQKDHTGVLKPVSPAINPPPEPVIKEEASKPAIKEEVPKAIKEDGAKSATKDDTSKAEEISVSDVAEKVEKEEKEDKAELPLTERKGSFVFIPDEGISHTSREKKKTNEELRTKAYRLRALGIVGKDE